MSLTFFDQLHVSAYNVMDVVVLAQQQQGGPLGPEFGKASPIGLTLLAAMGVFIIFLGWNFHRRFSRYNRRRVFAEENGLDLFDVETLDKAMAEAGVLDQRKKSWL